MVHVHLYLLISTSFVLISVIEFFFLDCDSLFQNIAKSDLFIQSCWSTYKLSIFSSVRDNGGVGGRSFHNVCVNMLL